MISRLEVKERDFLMVGVEGVSSAVGLKTSPEQWKIHLPKRQRLPIAYCADVVFSSPSPTWRKK